MLCSCSSCPLTAIVTVYQCHCCSMTSGQTHHVGTSTKMISFFLNLRIPFLIYKFEETSINSCWKCWTKLGQSHPTPVLGPISGYHAGGSSLCRYLASAQKNCGYQKTADIRFSPCFHRAFTADRRRHTTADGDESIFGCSWNISTIFVSIIIYIVSSVIIDAHRACLLPMGGHNKWSIPIDDFGHHCRVVLVKS